MFWNQAQTRRVGFPSLGEISFAREKGQVKQRMLPGIHSMKLDKVEPLVARFLNIEPARMAEHFSPAGSNHLHQIVAIRQQMVSRHPAEDEAYLRWRYRFTAPQQEFELEENRLWVFCKQGEILGFVGVESATLVLDGTPVKVAKLMDLMVKPDIDRKGLGVWMNLTLQKRGYPLVVLGSNPNSLGIMSKLFYRLPNQCVYKNILNSHRYFESRFGKGTIAASLAALYNTASPLLLQAKAIPSWRRLQVTDISRFTADQDAALAEMNASCTRFQRSSAYLNWRLLDNPRDEVTVTGLWHGQRLVGYFALAHRSRIYGGARIREAFLLDWGCLPGKQYRRDLTAALVEAQRQLRRRGYDNITAYSYHLRSNQLLRHAGLHYQQDESKTVSIFVQDAIVFERMKKADNWFITGADTDYA
jgi:hypothetical protein